LDLRFPSRPKKLGIEKRYMIQVAWEQQEDIAASLEHLGQASKPNLEYNCNSRSNNISSHYNTEFQALESIFIGTINIFRF
jgi:hypothetical protein